MREPSLSFADVLRSYRLRAGLSQEVLANRAGLSLRAVSDLERGRRRSPYPDTVRRLAHALRLTDDERARLESARPRPAVGALGRSFEAPASSNLPAQVTSFVGRQKDIAEIHRLLATT